MKLCGIYKITNLVNGKVYIGSSKNTEERWANHFKQLRGNSHRNRFLQNSWNKHGERNFQFEIIEECYREKLIEREQYWMDKIKCYDNNIGYNIRKVAESNFGVKLSEETKKKISESHKGLKCSKETKQKLSIVRKGKCHSEETKRKLSKLNKGENHPLYSKCHSEETKQKMSESRKGKRCGSENSMYGKHQSDESKLKMSDNRHDNSGENHSQNKLTWKQVEEIRQKYVPREYTCDMLAEEYGVCSTQIFRIINNLRWVVK